MQGVVGFCFVAQDEIGAGVARLGQVWGRGGRVMAVSRCSDGQMPASGETSPNPVFCAMPTHPDHTSAAADAARTSSGKDRTARPGRTGDGHRSAAAGPPSWHARRSPLRRPRRRCRCARRTRGPRRSRNSANWSRWCGRIQWVLMPWVATQGRRRPIRVHRWSYRRWVIGRPSAYRSSCPPAGACRSWPCSMSRGHQGGGKPAAS